MEVTNNTLDTFSFENFIPVPRRRYRNAAPTLYYETKGSRNTLGVNKGFTLLEILIAVAILGILVAVGIGNLDKVFGNQQGEVAKIFVNQTAKIGLTPYKLDIDAIQAQTKTSMLSSKHQVVKKLLEGSLSRRSSIGPWQNPYQYRFPGEERQCAW